MYRDLRIRANKLLAAKLANNLCIYCEGSVPVIVGKIKWVARINQNYVDDKGFRHKHYGRYGSGRWICDNGHRGTVMKWLGCPVSGCPKQLPSEYILDKKPGEKSVVNCKYCKSPSVIKFSDKKDGIAKLKVYIDDHGRKHRHLPAYCIMNWECEKGHYGRVTMRKGECTVKTCPGSSSVYKLYGTKESTVE